MGALTLKLSTEGPGKTLGVHIALLTRSNTEAGGTIPAAQQKSSATGGGESSTAAETVESVHSPSADVLGTAAVGGCRELDHITHAIIT